ncbi:hypothetical protein ACI2IY_05825 [Lysobacter enzymogenes]|uniref:hypothetical protein n=1 Tax=Lysobacter enzymogenes TaxID=69 RepID=UPI0038515B8F
MTAQIERDPRQGVELKLARRVGRWLWARREGLAQLIVYGLVYGLAVAICTRDPVAIGVVAFLAAAAAILGHCIDQATSPGSHL